MFGTIGRGNSRGISFAIFLALAPLATIAGGSPQSNAQTAAADTSRLPRIAGGTQVVASPATTIYTSPQQVATTADFVAKALAAEGWQSYVAPFTARANDPKMRIMSLKKGPQGLSVFITVAPAQNNATSVQYAAVTLKIDLPFPKDAADIEYSPDRPLLTCKSAEAVDKLLDFYRNELATSGWSLWSAKIGGKQPAGGSSGEMTPKGAYAFYIRDNTQPLSLVLQRADDGRVKVEIKGVSAEILALERQAEINKNKPPQPVAVTAPTATPAKQKTASDDMADDMMKQMQQAIESFTADALSGAKAAPPPSTAAAETLRALAGNDAPVPVPDTAEDVEFDGNDGKLEFNSKSSVASMAAFYRSAMKPQGWKEKTSVINRPNMVVLDFSKGGKSITLTIMQMGPKTNVSADGDALITAAAKPDSAPSNKSASGDAPRPASEDDLFAEESGGLPVPKRHTLAVGDSTPFRHALTASVPLDLADVLGFYRRELAKLNWKEESKGAVVAADRVVLAFTAAEGPAQLFLGRKNGETSVTLALKNPEAAKKAGILPKPGQTKVLFGNILPNAASLTFNNKLIKVAGGAGTKAPDGPTLDVGPGKYKYSIKSSGKPAQDDEIEVGADETWGLMIGPGGVLALRAY